MCIFIVFEVNITTCLHYTTGKVWNTIPTIKHTNIIQLGCICCTTSTTCNINCPITTCIRTILICLCTNCCCNTCCKIRVITKCCCQFVQCIKCFWCRINKICNLCIYLCFLVIHSVMVMTRCCEITCVLTINSICITTVGR